MTKLFKPESEFQKDAYISSMEQYWALCADATDNPEQFWGDLANQKIDWFKPYETVLNETKAPFYSWFDGGELNISHQCIDRHLKTKSKKTAIIWESEAGDTRKYSYGQLAEHVNRFANLLKNNFGVVKGDRVVLYMPMIPEALFAMLACSRIGAIHVVVFGGFSAEVLHERTVDTDAKLIITADGAFRHGKPYMLKPIVDTALDKIKGANQPSVLVVEHNHENISYTEGRDYRYNELMDDQSSECTAEPRARDDPSFILN